MQPVTVHSFKKEQDAAVSHDKVKSTPDLIGEEKQTDLPSTDTVPLTEVSSINKDEDKRTDLLFTDTSPLTDVSSRDKKQVVKIGICSNCCCENNPSQTIYEEQDTETSSIDDSYQSSPSPVPSLSKGLKPSTGDEEFQFTAAETDFSAVEDEYMTSEAETELTSVEDEYMGSGVELMDDDYMFSEGDPELDADGECSISVRGQNHSSVEYPLSEADKSLINAVDLSNVGGVTKALVKGASPDCIRDNSKRTPLHTAALNGDSTMVKLLLNAGASIDQKDTDLKTPLHLAAARGHEEVCILLIDTGANPFIKSAVGWTAVETAALWGHYYLADILRALSIEEDKEEHESKSNFYGC